MIAEESEFDIASGSAEEEGKDDLIEYQSMKVLTTFPPHSYIVFGII